MIRLFGCASLALFGALILAVLYSVPAVPLQAQTPAAELSALSLSSGTLRPPFAAATTEYRAAVKHNVSQFTVTATAATGVTVDYLDSADLTLADADTNARNGQQVDLAVGETACSRLRSLAALRHRDLHCNGGAGLCAALRLDADQGH